MSICKALVLLYLVEIAQVFTETNLTVQRWYNPKLPRIHQNAKKTFRKEKNLKKLKSRKSKREAQIKLSKMLINLIRRKKEKYLKISRNNSIACTK